MQGTYDGSRYIDSLPSALLNQVIDFLEIGLQEKVRQDKLNKTHDEKSIRTHKYIWIKQDEDKNRIEKCTHKMNVKRKDRFLL